MSAYFVQLVEVTENDGIVWQMRKELLAHLPSPLLLFFPAELPALCIGSALPVIAAEEGVATEYDVLPIDPTVICTPAIVIDKRVF